MTVELLARAGTWWKIMLPPLTLYFHVTSRGYGAGYWGELYYETPLNPAFPVCLGEQYFNSKFETGMITQVTEEFEKQEEGEEGF